MARQLKVYRNFRGGITTANPDNMLDTELLTAKNAIPSDRGGLSLCEGVVRYNATPFSVDSPVYALIEFGNTSGDTFKLVNYGNVLALWNGTVLTSGLSGRIKDWAAYEDKLYLLDGTDIWEFDGTTCAKATKPAEADQVAWDACRKAHAIETMNTRWFYSDPETDVMYYSEIGKPLEIKNLNSVVVPTDDGDTIIALKEYAGSLVIFKRKTVFGFTGTSVSDFTLRRLEASTGCVAPRTVQRVDNKLYYMGMDGLYMLFSPYPNVISSTPRLTNNDIEDIIKASPYKESACAVFYDNVYRLSLCTTTGQTVNDVEYRYYPSTSEQETGAWFGEFTHAAQCYLLTLDGTLYKGSTTTGVIFKCDEGYLYDGQLIPMEITFKPYDLAGNMVTDVKIKKFFLAFREYLDSDTHVDVSLKVDFKETDFEPLWVDESLVFGSGTFGHSRFGWNNFVTKEGRISEKGKRITLTVKNTTAGEKLTLYGIAFEYKTRKPKGTRFYAEGGE